MKTTNQSKKKKVISFFMAVFLISIILMGCVEKEKSNHNSKGALLNQESSDSSTFVGETISSNDETTPPTTNVETDSLFAEAETVEDISEKVFVAYFKGDRKVIEAYAFDEDNETFELFPGAGKETPIPSHKIKGAEQAEGKSIDDTCEIWCEFKGAPTDDYFQYLTITFIKKTDGWKVMSLGLEM